MRTNLITKSLKKMDLEAELATEASKVSFVVIRHRRTNWIGFDGV